MDIVFVINNLGGGGAERVVQTLSNRFVASGHKVSVIMLESGEIAYKLDERVRLIKLRTSGLAKGPVKLPLVPLQACELASVIKRIKPDVVLSALARSNIVNIMSGRFGNRMPKLISEHTLSSEQYKGKGVKGWAMARLVRREYPKADNIVAVSEGVFHSLVGEHHVDPKRIKTVYDPLDIAAIGELSKGKAELPLRKESFKIVTMGRMTPAKDHPTLLKAFAEVCKTEDAELVVIGSGAEEKQARRLAEELNISDKVWFAGWRKNPFAIMSKCDLFVLSSAFEGFGCVLVEAMACGLPVVSTDCPSGPGEILEGGKYGVLVPVGDANALAGAIEKFIKDNEHLKIYKKLSLERANDFDISAIAPVYIGLFHKHLK